MTQQAEKPVTWRSLAVLLAITLGLGAGAGLLTRGSQQFYDSLQKPVFAPPGWVFPVVWSLLYVLMAVAAWLYLRAGGPGRQTGLLLYFVQLAVNVAWPLLFFLQKALGLSFVWLLLLLALAAITAVRFLQKSRVSFYLFLPYLAWILFAGALNFSVARLN